MKMHVCDICKHYRPNAKIKYKYRAKEVGGNGWNKIELCLFCLDKIIEADKAESEEGDKYEKAT